MEALTSLPSLFHKATKKTQIWVALLITFFFVSGASTFHSYGLTWDEGLGNLFFGERSLHYFGSLNPKYLDFSADLESLKHYPLQLYRSPFHNTPNEFPALADTLSAATMYLFSYGLNWLNPIDGFHLFTVILATIFLWFFYRFAETHLGKFAALIALVFLATFPRFWADMHFNVKDVPEAIFFGFVIMAYWSWFTKPNLLKALGTGVLMGVLLELKLMRYLSFRSW